MSDYYSFCGYTFPESLLFGDQTNKVVLKIWSRWMNLRFKEIQKFLGLAFRYSPTRLEAACNRAIYYDQVSIPVIVKILEKKLDMLPLSKDCDIDGQIMLQF
jgi:hypothetical protein